MQIYGTCRCKLFSQSFTWRRGFVIFARISNLNHFLSIGPFSLIFIIVVDKNYIYMCRCLFIFMKQNLKWFFQSVSIKLSDFFFRSVYSSLNLFQALSKMVDRNWVIFTHWDFSFHWISFNQNSIKIMPLQQNVLFSTF